MQHYVCSLGARLPAGCNQGIICILGSLFPAVKDPIVLSWDLKTIYTPQGRSEELNGSADSSVSCGNPFSGILKVQLPGGLQEVAPTAQEKNRTKNDEFC